MRPPRTIHETLFRLARQQCSQVAAPGYKPDANSWRSEPAVAGLGLAVPSMRNHVTDEGWQIFAALEHSGYTLAGRGLTVNETDVRRILETRNPRTVVIQDKREYEGRTGGPGFNERERFRNVGELRERANIFKLTIVKDAHQQPGYNADAAAEAGIHAWITYYAPRIVHHLAPYTRPAHIIRTYHTIDSSQVPAYEAKGRERCLLSGAVSSVYPLRQRLIREANHLPATTVLRHPGYGRTSCKTPEYLQLLSRHRVAICTSSIYSYSLRKIIEAVACGCVVITDLAVDDILPEIDAALVRVHPDTPTRDIAALVKQHLTHYSAERAEFYAARARAWYDFRASGARLAADIEAMRRAYRS